VFHPNQNKVTKEQVRDYVRSHLKKQYVSLFGVKKFFGGGRTRGFCLIYDNEDSMRKIEPTYRMRRDAEEKLPPKERKKDKSGKKEGRKVKKVKKHQGQKKTGTKRRQEKNLERKQRKKKK
jgi:small subunit ribosomal protein S24e